MGDISEHFSWSEFQCKDGTDVPDELRDVTRRLVDCLEVIREAAGGVPVKIVSGYRTPYHNRRCGGERKSQHLKAAAADIQVEGVKPTEVYAIIKALISDGKIEQGGIGLYDYKKRPGFVHYDIRGTPARWRG